MRSDRALYLLSVVAILLSACGLLPSDGAGDVTPQATPTVEAEVVTPIAPNLPNTTALATPTPDNATLRVWIPPEIAARTEEGANTLADQIFAFDLANSEVTVILEQKRVRGAGGIVNYLRSGREIAPSIMPDLIAIPTDLLQSMATENLILPLGDQIGGEALEVLFPPALALGRADTNLLGYPFAIGTLPHLAFNNNVLTGTLPLTWDRLAADEENSYVFAADGTDGALLALQFYLDGGGQLVGESGQTILAVEPLTDALQFIQAGRDQGLFAAQASTVSSTDQAWQSFLGGSGNIVQTTADHFLRQTTDGLPVAYTIIPGIDRPLTPLVDGWAWAIAAQDTVRQAQALDLIQELTTAQNLADWSSDSAILPARRDALNAWPDPQPYVGFARQELERAQPLLLAPSSQLMTVLGDAVFQVVSGSKTAQQAAEDAVAAMQN